MFNKLVIDKMSSRKFSINKYKSQIILSILVKLIDLGKVNVWLPICIIKEFVLLSKRILSITQIELLMIILLHVIYE